MLTLVIALALGQHLDQTSLGRQNPPFSEVVRPLRSERVLRAGGRSGPSLAFFEAFPASGAGTSGVCSTTAPTGARGEALTFSRGSTATCTKTASGGLATTGIANGDLVVLASNQPRVEYAANGTLGLLVESSRTNNVIQSQAIDNASWTKTGTVIAAPTVTADFAVAPDGTTTADRIQTPACPTAGDESTVSIGYVQTIATWDHTIYVRGTSGAGSTTLAVFNSGGGSARVTCNYVAGSWSRCELTFAHPSVSASLLYVGCTRNAAIGGNVDTGAADFLLWGVQAELGAYATSYIPTTTVAVTRSAEAANFAAGTTLPQVTYSKAVSMYVPWATATQPTLPTLLMTELAGPPRGSDLFIASGGVRIQNGDGTAFTNITTSSVTFTALGSKRIAASSAAGTANVYVDGALFGASPYALNAAAAPGAVLYLDAQFGTSLLDGILSRICWDASPTRCR